MNQFGGKWTEEKISIVEDYAKAYLTIMKNYSYFKLIYFDGFAGSGSIQPCEDAGYRSIEGAAARILSIEKPRTFDIYYFVEICPEYCERLKIMAKTRFAHRTVYIVPDDCNKKLLDLGNFLREEANANCRVLAFIDPCGMQVEWSSVEALKNLGVDLWILVPTGVGVNRMLTRNGRISRSWMEKLQTFLGLPFKEIEAIFYSESQQQTFFGDQEKYKIDNAIQKAGELYSRRLGTLFKNVSDPYVLRNSMNSPMYHFILATDNKAGLGIANDVIKKRARYGSNQH
jgi:three-Cys-motif partner protein